MDGMTAARNAGELGMMRAADKAERTAQGWIAQVLLALKAEVAWLKAHTPLLTFTMEELRASIEEHNARPDGVDGRVWGAITREAMRLGYIEATGGYAPAASSNGSPKRLYRPGVNA